MKKPLAALGILAIVLVGAVVYVYSDLSEITRTLVEKEVPNLTFESLEVGWNSVLLTGVQYRSPQGKVLLKADTIRVTPSFRSFLSDTFRIAAVEIDKPWVYLQRGRSGELILPIPQPAPATQTRAGSAPAQSTAQDEAPLMIKVGRLHLRDGAGEFVDRSVGRPYANYKISGVNIEVRNLAWPLEAGRIPVDLALQIDGPRVGRVRQSGWVDPVNNSARLDVRIENLFVPHAEPYYRSADTTARLADGVIDVKLDIRMDRGQVVMPGELRMADLKFKDRRGKFFGVPADAVAGFVENTPALTIPFEVEGSRSDELRIKVLRVIAKQMLVKIGVGELGTAVDKLKQGDVEGAEKDIKKLEKKFKKLKDLF